MSAPFPANEPARLAALRAHQILDTPPEAAFDEIVRLAADICATPIATITFVDDLRQWFKARVGLSLTETPREDSFCAHAICELDREIFEIHDATADPRFRNNPLVVGDPGIRFYAGTPLIDDQGTALGTLCVIDREPRELTVEQRRALLALRRFVTNSLELRRLVREQRQIIDELERTRQELDRARQAAEAATAAKARFLAATSHEIRTPMNAVIGMATLLGGTSLSTEQREYVETIRTSGELLLALINDILDLSKIEAGRLDLEHRPFDLRGAVAAAAALVRAPLQAKGVQLELQMAENIPAQVCGDRARLGQILVNLLSNALKFTAAGRVTLRATATPTPEGNWTIHVTVSDSGIGISREQMKNLFQEYGQADAATSRRYGGTGLGLVISRRLAELHGGKMWVESEVGVGSHFHFTFQAAAATDVAPTAAPTAPVISADFAAQHPLQILLVDDNPVNLRVVGQLLRKLGYSPDTASSGLEAVAKATNGSFDLVLMDLQMPDIDGFAATRQIRGASGSQPLIVALTADAMAETRRDVLACGMNDFLAKPVRIPDLTTLLTEVRVRRAAAATPSGSRN